jgi:hypothetical protein
MNYKLLGISVLVFITTIQSAIAQPAKTYRLSTNGIGLVKVGMTVIQAEQASGWAFSTPSGGNRDGSCFTVTTNSLPQSYFMVINGKVARVAILNPQIMTLRGAKIGDSESRIKELYPEIKVTPAPYMSSRGAKYLTFYPKDREDRDYRLIFETYKGKVVVFRSGKVPAVEYIEGCA